MTEPDEIPQADICEVIGPDKNGMMSNIFAAFNTVITLQAYAPEAACRAAFADARAACRRYERLFSRTLPHSDVSRLNAAGGAAVEVACETAELLAEALHYCEVSEGCFDITIGPVIRLWDFHRGIVPDEAAIRAALEHVDWRGVHVWHEAGEGEGGEAETELGADAECGAASTRYFARLDDPLSSVDLGGIAKGWIADRITELMAACGLEHFIVNLGGNVMVHGSRPDGSPWRVGLKNPQDPETLVGSVAVRDASVVTSGVYERGFTRDGKRYHHILSTQTGYPVETDVHGATVIARRSIDAEGFSTTLLALGSARATRLAKSHPAILAIVLLDAEGNIIEA